MSGEWDVFSFRGNFHWAQGAIQLTNNGDEQFRRRPFSVEMFLGFFGGEEFVSEDYFMAVLASCGLFVPKKRRRPIPLLPGAQG